MKISIVTPVYNEEKNLKRYFASIKKINYPKEDFEIIFVDDGSTDNTRKVLADFHKENEINTRIVAFGRNRGRAATREEGAKAARYIHLLFLDCKCEICPDALNQLKKINYPVVNFTILQKNNCIFARFFYLCRSRIYINAPTKNNEDTCITPDNFDAMGKGTTAFFCEKNLFLNAMPDNKNDKNCSDDTKLLWNIVQKQPILSASKVKAIYHARTSFLENIQHIFHRGPKFVDYYYQSSKRYFLHINFALLAAGICVYLIAKQIYLKELLAALVLCDVLAGLYFARKINDFFVVIVFMPIFGVAFFTGIVKGLILKLFS